VALYHGGPKSEALVPYDAPRCRYGRLGSLGRAGRDVRAATLGTLTAAVLVGILATVATGFVGLPKDTANWVKGLILAASFVVVFGIVLIIVFVGCWATARRRHWETNCELLPDASSDHTLIVLRSRHWHHALHLYCLVGAKSGETWRAAYRYRDHWLTPGESVVFAFPSEFVGAPWPETGQYRVTWLTDVEHGRKPVVLARTRWKITEVRPAPPIKSSPLSPSQDVGWVTEGRVARRIEILGPAISVRLDGVDITAGNLPQTITDAAGQSVVTVTQFTDTSITVDEHVSGVQVHGVVALAAVAAGIGDAHDPPVETDSERPPGPSPLVSPPGLHVRAAGFARHSRTSWNDRSRVESDGQIQVEIWTTVQDLQLLHDCTVKSPDGKTARAIPSPAGTQASYSFTYPSDFDASVSLPLAAGEYAVEWTAVGGALIRLHAFNVPEHPGTAVEGTCGEPLVGDDGAPVSENPTDETDEGGL
jgi:hypothetical protein